MNSTIEKVTQRIIERSRTNRDGYLRNMEAARVTGPFRHRLPSSNLAHGLAVCQGGECQALRTGQGPNIGIITSYNDMLSAHHTYEQYPAMIKKAIAAAGGTAQVAGGVPAMCDGVTQGEPGMDLSLISRDVIAMSTVIGLSHNVFDGALLLGICDKIMPGLVMGALQFGHLPMILVPGGPMRSGLSNREKALAREQFAQGKISKEEMLAKECASYHGAGTCTFYGTANSNQLIAEIMGLHLPGASFVNPDDPLREALTNAASARVCELTHLGDNYTPIGKVVSERSVVNGIVGLLATGGSTNQTMHLVAMARAAGIRINWDDFSELSEVVPLLVRIYPNGPGDINSFQQAGGMAVLIGELLEGGFLHNEVLTVAGPGMERYTQAPVLASGKVQWTDGPGKSLEPEVIASVAQPFSPTGGLKVLDGNIGRAVIKVSSLADGAATCIEAPAMVFHTQHALEEAFQAGKLDRDLVAVIRFQGPQATGMPELHKLITPLSVIMGRGYRVAMVTDGRLSGASGKVPAAIHVTPEALCGGLLAKVQDGDMIRVDVGNGSLELLVDKAELAKREYAEAELEEQRYGVGRQIFAALRSDMLGAEEGASSLFTYVHEKCKVNFAVES
ncbi:MAG: phosphogluconate dehydratase [Desulfurivibrio sp.]|nr:phosphogluconate dehydratase [Desulfurivibrio sp.]MBU4033437.1 phosphogluconate dehydratase [Pseudomonadota bacterium]MBU4117300.1 phosphogluconate dehydratase [Pseudomonadota bacterium]